MQFLVFGAFAVVLSVPQGGPPWATIQSVWGSWLVVIGQAVVVGAVGCIFSFLVKRKLDREPAWLHGAQTLLNQGNLATRIVIVLGYLSAIYLTDWTRIVRGWSWATSIWGLDEVIMLLPFLVDVLIAWIALFPADRAVRQVATEMRLFASVPARPVWRLGQYLSFMFRQNVLIIAVPMLPIVVAYDFSQIHAEAIIRATGIPWAHEAVVVIVAGIVFLLAPAALCHIWQTRPLPAGELRDRLESLCRRINMRYRRILIWETDGMVVNAAVMGLFRPVRYILLSDGLIEMMDDRKIEAVFGHEAGHVKKHHIPYYLLFAILSMLIVGGAVELIRWTHQEYPNLLAVSSRQLQEYLHVMAMGMIVLVWGLGFGVVSRRFEWQADLYGAMSVTPSDGDCAAPCRVHGTATNDPSTADPPERPQRGRPLCATAANLFADALERIAILNGIPVEAKSWRHSSIQNRMELLRSYADDPCRTTALLRTVALIKAILLAGTVIGLIIAAWLYWPEQWTRFFTSS